MPMTVLRPYIHIDCMPYYPKPRHDFQYYRVHIFLLSAFASLFTNDGKADYFIRSNIIASG